MFTYVVRRLLYSIPVLIGASFLIFTFVSVSGDPLSAIKMRPHADPHSTELLVKHKHLDQPVVVRYGYWVKEAVTQKFGRTLLGDQRIWPSLERVFGHTLQLVITAEIVSLLLAIAIGVYSAIRQYSVADYVATTVSFLGLSTPVFWLALVLQVLFTNIFLNWNIRIFYTAQLSSADPGTGLHWLADRAQHLALPVFCLAFLNIANYSRFLRASMLEVINSDYVRTARAKGLPNRKVYLKHAFRNALIPLATVVALNFSALLGGAIATETVFQLDGMGLYFINALQKQDPYPVMAWLMIVACTVILLNLLADIAYGVLDPRIRYQ